MQIKSMNRKNLLIISGLLIIFFILYLISRLALFTGSPKVISVSPAAEATSVSIFEKISVIFSRSLSLSEQKGFKIDTEPQIEDNLNWSQDDKVLTLIPKTRLEIGQKYNLRVVRNGNLLYSWSFTTTTPQQMSTDDQIKTQAESDEDFGRRQKEIEETYPFINKLPIYSVNKYLFYFDIEKKKFVGRLYTKGNKFLVKPYQDEILAEAKSRGIDTSAYEIEWEEVTQ